MYNPQELNQLVINQALAIHEECMAHALDTDQTVYQHLDAHRDLMITVCKAASAASNAWLAHARRFDVPVPLRIRLIRRMRAPTGA